VSRVLPCRRLLLCVGQGLVTVDLGQVREVGGVPGPDAVDLGALLDLPGGLGPAVTLVLETTGRPVAVAVDAVGGVVEVPSTDVRPVPVAAGSRVPGLVRGILRVPRPPTWRRGSLLPTPAAQVAPSGAPGDTVLAADLDPVALASLVAAARVAREGGGP
jgi:hypothetical protein